jgi:hypothetical protein
MKILVIIPLNYMGVVMSVITRKIDVLDLHGIPQIKKSSSNKKRIFDVLNLDKPQNEKCAICLEGLAKKVKKTLDCSHQFHQVCVDEWVKKKADCPLCRQKVFSVSGDQPASESSRETNPKLGVYLALGSIFVPMAIGIFGRLIADALNLYPFNN